MFAKYKMRKKILTFMILSALYSSSAYAMPTGGNVVMGNVTNVANPAELMTANANSIIDWNSFSIAVGEQVNFDTRNFMVLNRVVGGQESQLLGMLSDKGNGQLILINPNGIVVGDNAMINVNDLTLSTLSLSNNDFQRLINGDVVEFAEVKDGKISIGSNANLTMGEALRLYGGKISIADGVEIVSKENVDAALQISASESVTTSLSGTASTIYGAGNDIKIGCASLGTIDNPLSGVEMRGDNLFLDTTDIVVDNKNGGNEGFKNYIFISGSDLSLQNAMLINNVGDTYLVGRRYWQADYDDKKITKFSLDADLENKVSLKNSVLIGKNGETIIIGGNIDIKKSSIDSGNDLFVGALKTYDSKYGVKSATAYDKSIVNIDNGTTLNSVGRTTVFGSIINLDARLNGYVVFANNPLNKYLDENHITIDDILEDMKGILFDDEIRRIKEVIGGRVISSQADIDALDKFNDYILSNNIVDEGLLYMSLDKSFSPNFKNGFNQSLLSKNEIVGKMEIEMGKIKDFCSILKDISDDDFIGGEAAGVINSIGEFGDTIKDFANDDNHSGADWLNLIYKYLDHVDSFAKLFEKLPEGKFNALLKKYPYITEGIGGVANLVGVISKEAFVFESIANKEYSKALDGIPEIFNQYTDVIMGVEQASTGTSGLKAIFSDFSCGVTVAKAGISGLCQLEKSIAKYGQDGNINQEDVANVMIDVSTRMIEEISNHSLGVGDMLYGKIRKVYGTENDGLSNSEQASAGYKILAEEIGKSIAEKDGNLFKKMGAGIEVGGKIIGEAFAGLFKVLTA